MEQPLPFHQRLKLERERLSLSQEELAECMGCNVKTITHWETGGNIPQPHYRQKFCELFDKTPEELGLITYPKQSEQSGESSPRKEDWGEAP